MKKLLIIITTIITTTFTLGSCNLKTQDPAVEDVNDTLFQDTLIYEDTIIGGDTIVEDTITII